MNLKALTLLLAALLAATALAGCTDNADDGAGDAPGAGDGDTTVPGDDGTPSANETPADNETPVGNETPTEHTLTVDGVPSIVTAGNEFTFQLHVAGPVGTSDHLGAHISNNTTAAPGAGRLDCAHETTVDLPGTFNVTCTIPTGGVWYLYGHVQTVEGEERLNHWAEPVEVVAYDYDLILEQTSDDGLTANFTLNITGAPESTSTHAGAHYSTEPVTGAFSTSTMGACGHDQEAWSAPSNFTVSCTFTEAGTYYVYGHYRVTSGDFVEDFWSAPVTVTVEAPAASA